MTSDWDDLAAHLGATTALSPAAALRVIDEVIEYFSEPVEEFVRRRHRHHQQGGLSNPEIFGRIRNELAHRVVAPPALTERQVRRIVYG